MKAAGARISGNNGVRAWDLPTRIVKWLLVASVVTAWATNKYAVMHPNWHKWCGYGVLVLLVFRLLWGIVGARTARFSSFVVGPRTVARYVWGGLRGNRRRYLGHNPLGGWMVLALLCAIGAQAVTGLFSAAGDWMGLEGPLAHRVSNPMVDRLTLLHRWGFDLLLWLIVGHIVANFLYDLVGKAGLLRGMITGRKPAVDYCDPTLLPGNSVVAALICLLAAVLIVCLAVAILA